MEILRLAGGPGVGKSAVAWKVAQRLRDDGVRIGYVDIDQVGMCYPAPNDDPDRWALKERALERIARGHESAGAQVLVVSGVAETRIPPPRHGHPVTSIWLDAAEPVRRVRLTARDWTEQQVRQALTAGTAESAHAHPEWIRLPTDDLVTEEVADRVLDTLRLSDVPAPRPDRRETAASRARGIVRWITGPRLVGASTVGWRIVSERWAAGVRTGFADAAQLAFAPDARGAAVAGVVALHEVFADLGAEHLVVVAPDTIAPDDVVAAFPHADVVIVRLEADERSRRARADERRAGRGPILAGDDVAGATDAEIEALIAAQGSRSDVPGVLVVDTSGLDATAATRAVRAALVADDRPDRRRPRS